MTRSMQAPRGLTTSAPARQRYRARPASRPVVRFAVTAVKAATLLVVFTGLIVVAMGFAVRWNPPEHSAFMEADPASPDGLVYQHVALDHVSRNMIAAVIGHEDQLFTTRTNGVDYGDYARRAKDYLTHTDDEIGSTLPEQLAKNLWLTPTRNPVRMIVEVAITEGMMVAVPKDQQLELYLNFAQFGPHLYGICAASWYYYGTPPSYMTLEQAVRLTGILPGPAHVVRGTDGGFRSDGTVVGDKIIREVGYAQQHGQQWFDAIGGYAAAQSIGISGFAADHRSDAGPDSCAHRPDSVTRLLRAGGYAVPAEPR